MQAKAASQTGQEWLSLMSLACVEMSSSMCLQLISMFTGLTDSIYSICPIFVFGMLRVLKKYLYIKSFFFLPINCFFLYYYEMVCVYFCVLARFLVVKLTHITILSDVSAVSSGPESSPAGSPTPACSQQQQVIQHNTITTSTTTVGGGTVHGQANHRTDINPIH